MKKREDRLRRSGRTKLPRWRVALAVCGGAVMAFLTYFFFLNWSVVNNFDATSALLKGDILALQLANPNLDSLKASQAQVLSQLYQEQETSALQFPSSKKAIAKAIELANQVNQEIDLRSRSSSASSLASSSSSQSAPSSQSAQQMTQERQQEVQNQQKLNSLLSSNTLNPSSSSADSSTAVPQSQKVTKPW
ncbi:MAG: hypothetical protein J6P10_00535 [Aeriscardovia sp.]|nr:hypothetical protein [Aeriscardovia sp.]